MSLQIRLIEQTREAILAASDAISTTAGATGFRIREAATFVYVNIDAVLYDLELGRRIAPAAGESVDRAEKAVAAIYPGGEDAMIAGMDRYAGIVHGRER